jgi:hypothetical protein
MKGWDYTDRTGVDPGLLQISAKVKEKSRIKSRLPAARRQRLWPPETGKQKFLS